MVAFSREAIDFSARIDADVVVLDFDFLDAGDGAVIEVVHRGATPPEIVGTVRGADMKGRGATALTRPAIEWMASQGRIRRFIGPLGFSTARMRKRSFMDFGVMAVAPIFGIGLILWEVAVGVSRRTMQLVPTAQYDLASVEGQRAFASAVAQHTPDGAVLFLLGFQALMSAGFLLVVIRRGRRTIPASVGAIQTGYALPADPTEHVTGRPLGTPTLAKR